MMVNDSFDEGEPERVKADEHMQAAVAAAHQEIDRLMARPNAKKLREALAEWSAFPEPRTRLQEVFDAAAAEPGKNPKAEIHEHC